MQGVIILAVLRYPILILEYDLFHKADAEYMVQISPLKSYCPVSDQTWQESLYHQASNTILWTCKQI